MSSRTYSTEPDNYCVRCRLPGPVHRHARSLLLLLLLAALLPGCRGTPNVWNDNRPLTHSVSAGNFIIRSDFAIAETAPMIRELEQLQHDITTTLQLPKPRDPVIVYLFSGESAYRRYMRKTWPSLPARRAYFIGTSRELAVYSFHGPRVEEDLRHELTHGLLHATLKTVPLWLDEGLAEYFEVRGSSPGSLHPEHVRTLQRLSRGGWKPSVGRLEDIVDFRKFDREDYAESWGWVHFLLHDDPGRKESLLAYLHDLRDSESAGSFLARLRTADGSATHQLTAYVTNLNQAPQKSFPRL